MFLPLISHTQSRLTNMDGDVQMVESGDQEIYGRRCESQPAISTALAYVCISKKKSQKLKLGYYMNLKALPPFSTQQKGTSYSLLSAINIFFAVQFRLEK
jgi:hypothetical protein